MSEDQVKHLHELLESFDTGMLISRHDEQLHARPMALAAVEGPNTLWFVTSANSPKALEIRTDGRMSVTFQSSKRFVALSGRGTLVRDRDRIDELWKAAWRVWFPEGKDDPDLSLICVTVQDAEFWDNAGGKGVRYVFEAAKALISGHKPELAEGQHGRVKRNGSPAAPRR